MNTAYITRAMRYNAVTQGNDQAFVKEMLYMSAMIISMQGPTVLENFKPPADDIVWLHRK